MPNKNEHFPYFKKALLRCKIVCLTILLGGGVLGIETVNASILSTRTISDVSTGSKLTTTTFNSLLRVVDAMFWDEGLSPMSRGFGTTTDPTIFNSNGNCPAGYTHVDFNNDGNEDTAECWQGLLAKNGQLGIGTMDPSSALEVVGTIKATGFSGSGAWLTDLDTTQLTDWATATDDFVTSSEFSTLTTGWDTNAADDYDSADFTTDFEAQTSDDLTEGSTNLYFTDPRAVSAVGGVVNDLGSTVTDIWSAFKIRDYIESNGETDPVYTAWDKSTGITITESQISDLAHYTDADIDGTETAFTGWDKNVADDFDGTWASLTGVPADIADGDDTIADGVSCSADEILKWNGSVWTCSTDVNTDDQTATEVTATDNFTYSAGTEVQTVLEDLDTQLHTTQTNTLTNAANIEDNTAAIALKSNVASPAFTGDPMAPTPTAGDDDTSISTTAFVTSAISTATSGFLTTETDPVYSAWNKSTGVSITASQVSNFDTAAISAVGGSINDSGTATTDLWSADKITTELANAGVTEADPVFLAWDKSTGISITESQISDLQSYISSESDPVFLAWNKSTGVSITESQILDLQAYLTSETDPVYTAWNKSTGIEITTSQISDWDAVTEDFVAEEADPIFTAWDKSTGITITESQITDLDHYNSFDFNADLATKDTDDLAEGVTNLYFADTLAINAIGGQVDDSDNTTATLWSANKIESELSTVASKWSEDSGNVYRSTGNVGIGINPPLEKLDVSGGVRFGNTTGTNAGTVRWTGTDLELYGGAGWKSIAGGLSDVRQEHSGFPNRTDSTISFNDGTRTFTIAPTGTSFDYYQYDEKFTVSSADSVQISDVEGMHYIYFNGATLSTATTVASLPQADRDWVMVAMVNWDADLGQSNFLADERHGLTMDWATQTFLHNALGTMWVSGLGLNSMTVDGAGAADADVKFGVTAGQILDEDKYHDISSHTTASTIPIFYVDGNDWKSREGSTIPMIHAGDGTWGSGQRVPYAYYNDTGATVDGILDGEWGLREVPDGEIVLMHYFATTDATGTRGVIGVQGKATYDTVDYAEAGAATELSVLMSMNNTAFSEFSPIATVLVQTDDTYTNTAHARIVSTLDGDDYLDLRTSASLGGKIAGIAGGVGSGSGEHGDLAGLDEDQHLQYALLAGRSTGQTLIGGTDTTDDLTLRATAGAGTTGSDIIFEVGNNGATEAMRIDNTGAVGVGTAPSSTYKFDVNGDLHSEKYVMGTDLSLQPVAGGQSAVSSWWGLQLVGNQQSSVNYTPSNYGAADDFSVIIPNQQSSKIGLVIRGAAGQSGNLTEWQDSAGTVLSVVDENGHIGVGVADPTTAIDVSGTVTATAFAGDGSQLTGVGADAASALTVSAVVAEAGGISAGQCVYISGAVGGVPQVSLCDNTVQSKIGIAGIAAESKVDTETILIRVSGELDGVDTSAWSDGDTLYMSTGGALTNVRPTTGSVKNAGRVAYSHATTGKILVSTGIKEWYVSAADGQNVDFRMGDSAGATKVSFEDNTNTEVAHVDSNGNADFSGTVTVDTLTATTGITGMVIGTDVAAAGSNSDITSLTGLQTSIIYSGTARPTRQVTLSPEYPGATLTGDGVANSGVMTSDFCSNSVGGLPDVETAVCDTTGDIHNYYNWTTSQSTAQDYDIFIRWRIPDNFSSWGAVDPISIWAKRHDAANNAVQVFLYDTANVLVNTGGTQVAEMTWTETSLASSLSGTFTPGQYITIQIKLTADTDDAVQVGEISLDYLSTN